MNFKFKYLHKNISQNHFTKYQAQLIFDFSV